MSYPTPYFQNVPSYGNLSIEYIIVDDDAYPILFVLENVSKKRFICVCCDIRDEQRWIINPIDYRDLYKLLCNQITLSESFLIGRSNKVIAVHCYETNTDSYQLVTGDELDADDLPVSGEFLDANRGEHGAYMIKLLDVDTSDIDGIKDTTSNVRNVSKGETISYTTDLEEVAVNNYIYSKNDEQEFCGSMPLLAA